MPLSAALSLALLVHPAAAAVPDGAALNAQTFRPSADTTRFFRVVGPELPAELGTAGALLSYTLDPLVYTAADGTRTPVVANVVQLDVTAAYRLGPVSFGADLPVYLRSFGGSSPDASGFGDPAFTGKVQILEPGEAPIGLGAWLRGVVPVSGVPDGLGASGAGADVALAVSRGIGRKLDLAANVGLSLTPTVELPGATWGSQGFVDLGIAYAVTTRAGASVEVHAAGLLDDLEAPAAAPAEVLVGGWYRLGGHRTLVVRPALGFGLTDAIGSPRLRALVSFAYDPVQDR